MFGYVKPFKPHMRICEFETYNAVYCGLCKKLGKKYKAAFNSEPWAYAKFVITKPFFYHYRYASSNEWTPGGDSASSTFMSIATASLSDGFDSTFAIQGDNCGYIGNIVDFGVQTALMDISAPDKKDSCRE